MRRPGIPQMRAAPNPGGYTPIWPPTKLPGCVAWLDMQETFTAGGTVTSITNMVSSVTWDEATNPPTFDPIGINGLPCMAGNGSSMRILSTESAAVAPVVGVGRPWTAVAVQQLVTANSGTTFGYGSTANNTTRGQLVLCDRGALSTGLVDDTGAVNLTLTDSYQMMGAGALVVASVCYGSTLRHFVNIRYRSGLWPAPTGQITPDQLGLLCRPRQTPDTFSNVRLGCQLFFGRALPESQLFGIVASLMGRWRIGA